MSGAAPSRRARVAKPRRALVPLVNLRMAATDLRARLPSSAADVYVAKLPEGGGGDMEEPGLGAPSPLSVRHRFDWTAHFDPALLTDDRVRLMRIIRRFGEDKELFFDDSN